MPFDSKRLWEIATREKAVVGKYEAPFDATVISLTSNGRTGYVKIHKTTTHHFVPEFIEMEAPEELTGAFTHRSLLLRAIRDYADRLGETMTMKHVASKTGKELEVNVKSL